MAQVLPDARNPALADLTSCQDWWAKPVSAAAFAFSLCAAGTLAAGWDGTGAGASRDQPQEAAES
jgi:anti-sigma factor RsiW